MEIIIVHYHLNRGGVTRVIENHLHALAALRPDKMPVRVTIVYGGRAAAWNHDDTRALPFEVELTDIPALDYDNESPHVAGQLLSALNQLLASRPLGKDATVLHVHNHSLGKNAALLSALARLASEGWRMLLHIHDFAEDLRPSNYQHLLSHASSSDQLHRRLYPQGPQIHYAVLNQRDYGVLAQAGVQTDRLHLLPNPVSTSLRPATGEQAEAAKKELAGSFGMPSDHAYVLYPVRAIRRKNVGELLLWSQLVEDATFAVTLAPLNPQEQTSYDGWVSLAASLALPVFFDVGNSAGLSLDENYAAADAVITTSVAEGFGLVYLEATLADRHLVGRSLPGITDDFRMAGMQFPGLADKLWIPAEWVDVQELKQKYLALSRDLRAAFGLPPKNSAHLKTSIEDHFAGDTVDFGRLDSASQQSVLRRIHRDAALRQTLRGLNPIGTTIGDVDDRQRDHYLAENRRVIERCYSLDVIGVTLREVYDSILSAEVGRVDEEPSIARSILDRFVLPSQLFPIRLEP